MVGEMDGKTVEAVSDRRAGLAAGGVVGAEHEMVNEQLRAAPKQVGERGAAFVGVEAVLLVDLNPGQLPAPVRQLVAAVG